MARQRSAIFPESFATIRMTDLYRHGVLGPKHDRLRLTSSPSGTLIQNMVLGASSAELRAKLADGHLFVSGDLLLQDAFIALTEIHYRKDGWGHRAAFLCPGCKVAVFHLSVPLVERRPDGLALSRGLLCRGCHQISRPSWRYAGHQTLERAGLHRRSMAEKLGPNPTTKAKGVATVRHDKWFARYLNAERRLLASL